ncbi:integrase [Nocardioides albus]|nr:integrase [Nocardioides albus]
MTDRAYVRISLDTEASASITKQRDRLTKKVLGDDGDPDKIAWYEDRSVSGSKVAFRDRPEGGRLFRELKQGDRVLVTKIDRAARNVEDLLGLVRFVEETGATITFADDDIDTKSNSGKLILTVLAAIAEFEARLIGERRRQSLEVMKKEGRHAVGSAPYGFVAIKNPNGRGLVIRPDHEVRIPFRLSPAEALRDAVMAVINGKTYEEAKAALPVSMSGFKHLLHNPRLAGMTPDHDYEIYTTSTGREAYRLSRASEGVLMVDGTPLIDPDMALLTMAEWMALREMLESRKLKAWEVAKGYGSGMTCGVCGERLYRHHTDKRPSKTALACIRKKHAKGDPGVSIAEHRVNPYIEETFLRLYGQREHVEHQTIEESAVRLEAISRAKVALIEAQKALTAAVDDAEEDEAYQAVRAAKRAVREAEAMPTERVTKLVPTGETWGDLWESSDDLERCELLRLAGTWAVVPGRGLALDKKIVHTQKPFGIAVDGERVVMPADLLETITADPEIREDLASLWESIK